MSFPAVPLVVLW